MSALRIPGPDGRTRLVIDEGWPEVRARHFRIGSSTGPIIYGSFPVGQATDRREQNREWRRNHREQEVERKRRDRQRARSARPGQPSKLKADPPPKPVCGAPMMYDETCGRRPGHAPSHRSRTVMDADRDARKARKR